MYKRLASLCLSLALTASIAAFTPPGNVSAATGDNEIHLDTVDVDQASQFVTIRGSIDSGSGKEVTVKVTDPNGKTDYINQTTSGENGAFAFTYLPSESVSGEYQLKVGGENVNVPVDSSFEIGDFHTSAGATLTGPDSVLPGQVFDLTYGLHDTENEVLAQDVTVTYDTYHLEFTSVSSLDEERFVILDHKDTPGQIRLLGVHFGDMAEHPNQSLLKLSFKTKTDVQSGIANVAIVKLTTANSEGVETELDGASHNVRVNVIDKAALNALIAEAQRTHDNAVEGTHAGEYPTGAKAALQTVINQAKDTADNPAATQEQVESATSSLQAALTAFRNSVITSPSIPGDHNNDQRLSIGDLAIVANSYGMKAGDEGWDAVKSSDINNDGVIDIEDLAALARLILNG